MNSEMNSGYVQHAINAFYQRENRSNLYWLHLIAGLTLLFLLGFAGTSRASPICQLTNLGGLGSNYGAAWAINDLGQIVGSARAPAGQFEAVLFDASGNVANNQVLGSVTGTGGWANDINNSGQIVGYSDKEVETVGRHFLIPRTRQTTLISVVWAARRPAGSAPTAGP